jgi:23S rRNA-/tRNA-specific pseudouridylate synthase
VLRTTTLFDVYSGRALSTHRLDRVVSGVLVLAKTKAFAATMAVAFSEGSALRKEYFARVWGKFPPGVHRIDAPLCEFLFIYFFCSQVIWGFLDDGQRSWTTR